MANKAASDTIKASASKLAAILAPAWGDIAVKAADGKIDPNDTKRAFGRALHDYLVSTGAMKGTVSRGPAFDTVNVTRAVYSAFCKLAKSATDSVGLSELTYAGLNELGPTYAEMDRVKRAIHSVITTEGGRFTCVRGENKFAGTIVKLNGPATAPEPFTKWGVTPAPTPAPAPAAPAASKANGNGGKGPKGATASK